MGCRNNGLSEFWVVGIMLRIRFVSHLYSLSIMYMGHVLFPIFILCLSCTWAMFCFLSLYFVYHVHGPSFFSHLSSLFIMYMGHVLLGSGHYLDSPLFRQPIAPTAHYSDSPLLRQPISPTTHYSVKNGQK